MWGNFQIFLGIHKITRGHNSAQIEKKSNQSLRGYECIGEGEKQSEHLEVWRPLSKYGAYILVIVDCCLQAGQEFVVQIDDTIYGQKHRLQVEMGCG